MDERVKATPLPCCLQGLSELAGVLNFLDPIRVSFNFRGLKGQFKTPATVHANFLADWLPSLGLYVFPCWLPASV